MIIKNVCNRFINVNVIYIYVMYVKKKFKNVYIVEND